MDLGARRPRIRGMDRRGFLGASAVGLLAPRALAGRLGGTPVALVTADLESHIVAVELGTGRRLRTIPTLPGPRSIERVGDAAVVAHTEEGAVSILDGATLRVRRVLPRFVEPRYTVASPEGRYAFVSDSGTGQLVVLDVLRGIVVARVRVGGPARHLSLRPDGRRLWVSLGSKAREIAVLDVRDPARPRLVRRFSPPWLAHDVGFGPRSRVWVTSGDRRELALYDAASGRLVRRLPAGAPPQHVTFLGSRAYVTSGDDGTLEVRSATTGVVHRTTRVPLGSYNVQEGWGVLLTPSLERGTLCIAAADGRLLHRLTAARSSHDACFAMAR
jgi:DNA-binding beta-propeller fold protein YncE